MNECSASIPPLKCCLQAAFPVTGNLSAPIWPTRKKRTHMGAKISLPAEGQAVAQGAGGAARAAVRGVGGTVRIGVAHQRRVDVVASERTLRPVEVRLAIAAKLVGTVLGLVAADERVA